MNETPLLDADALASLCAAVKIRPCRCALAPCAGWTAVADHEWPSRDMQTLGTLRDVHDAYPGFDEYHPRGTRLDSPEAPISPAHYPCNRADVWQCRRCGQVALRYDEVGGYYRESRARRVAATLIVTSSRE
jgi:hypothetical protein